MANNIQQEIMDRLERLKEGKKRPDYMQPKAYQDFMPKTLDYKKPDDSARYAILDQIDQQGTQATANALEEARQDALRRQYLKMVRAQERTRHQLQQAKANQPKFHPHQSGGGFSGGSIIDANGHLGPVAPGVSEGAEGNGQGHSGYGGYNGSPPQHVGVGRYLTTVHAAGHSFTVNRYVADRFTRFVRALVARGYHPVSISGYSNRNQANGSGLKSLHAYGLAIDIDPGRNPFTSGPAPHAIPNWAGSLAAKYGLVWGGTWKHSKDYMHFSVPYGGRM